MSNWRIILGDALESLRAMDAGSVQTCVTSPPYWGLRDYGVDGQIGLESTPEQYVARIVEVFSEVRRVLRDDGTLWLNIGDSYAANRAYQVPSTKGGPKHSDSQSAGGKGSKVPDGLKPKDLIGIPWRVAFALQADGWYLRQDIIWHKPNPMPESVTDRCTKAHEYIFMLAKSERYYYDAEAIKEPSAEPWRAGIVEKCFGPSNPVGTMRNDTGRQVLRTQDRNRRSVWTVSPAQFSEAHFATFPPKLIEPCILAGAPEGGTVLDPFNGSGTTGLVCIQHQRRYIGIELNPEYVAMSERRLSAAAAQGVLFSPAGVAAIGQSTPERSEA